MQELNNGQKFKEFINLILEEELCDFEVSKSSGMKLKFGEGELILKKNGVWEFVKYERQNNPA